MKKEIKKQQCYLKIVMTEEQKYELKLKALQENKTVSALVLEMIGLKEEENVKETLIRELREKQNKLSSEGAKMTVEERKQFKDRISYIKKKLEEM